MSPTSKILDTRCCIVGAGPAGIMLGLLLARAGIKTIVLEKHKNFLRDFRGDTVHPSTLAILDELGLKQAFDALPQHRISRLQIEFDDGPLVFGDFSSLKPYSYLSLVPQWDLLDLLAHEASHYENFSLCMQADATGLLFDDNAPATDRPLYAEAPAPAPAPATSKDEVTSRIKGVRASTPDGELLISADLVIACDGRHSTMRDAAKLQPENLGAPMDVLWFRIPRADTDPQATFGIAGHNGFLVLLNRNDYWQVASVIPKGHAQRWRAQPISKFREYIARRAPVLAAHVAALETWQDVKLLEVHVDRLARWHRPGLLLIGDAAHAMSPIGGVGINLAIQDAVAAANILAPTLLRPGIPDEGVLAAVQKRRMLPTRLIQGIQLLMQRRLIAPALAARDSGKPTVAPPLARLLLKSGLLRSIPARVFGLGFRREHVRSPCGKQDDPERVRSLR